MWELAKFLLNPKQDISWGLTVDFAFWLFAGISIVGTMIGQLIFKPQRLAIQYVSFLVFAAFFFNIISDRPFRVLLLQLCGLISFVVPFLLLKKYELI